MGSKHFALQSDKIRSIYNQWKYKIVGEHDDSWFLYKCERLAAELCGIRATNMICSK
jgi:hypothetical protein